MLYIYCKKRRRYMGIGDESVIRIRNDRGTAKLLAVCPCGCGEIHEMTFPLSADSDFQTQNKGEL
ncbi:MAG TPA: hypothetical protein DCX32_01375 [Candidatus Moranbacteria bacterium]|nr:MAG: hypothetical protein UW95_C0007G0016 [Parcubacteria group bacterium GW2011_GWC1_45_14]HAV11174.1 hypothetical protein [Candidatus Moranbacteria bacterium]